MADAESEAESRDGPQFRTLAYLAFIVVAAASFTVGSWFAQSHPRPAPLAAQSRVTAATSATPTARTPAYVGKAACLECHPGESALVGRSGHDRTFRRAEHSPIIDWLDGKSVPDPEIAGLRWSYHVRENRLVVDRTKDGRTESFDLDFGLGSGKHGVTFLAIQGDKHRPDPSAIEHRVSYLASNPRLAMTPGQEGAFKDPHEAIPVDKIGIGRALGPQKFRECVGCHTTSTSTAFAGRFDADHVLPNVSCERCHGPGGDHIAAARRGDMNLSMPLGHMEPEPWKEVNLCGECHRVPRTVSASAINPDNPGIVRFQGVGISMSACYAKALGSLRCTTCHDPHDRASEDVVHYETACLSCHRSAPAQTQPAQNACPISPAKGCIGCHMPKREVRGNGIFTDHWIRKPSARQAELPGSKAVGASAAL